MSPTGPMFTYFPALVPPASEYPSKNFPPHREVCPVVCCVSAVATLEPVDRADTDEDDVVKNARRNMYIKESIPVLPVPVPVLLCFSVVVRFASFRESH